MTEDRLIHAFDRLEQAIAALEGRLDRPPAPPSPAGDPALEARHARLTTRHDALRTQAGAALARLDRLLDDGGED